MRVSKSRAFSPDILEVQKRFEQWRLERQGKGSIPLELWAAAVSLARVHGVPPVCQALRLNHNDLKARLAMAFQQAPAPKDQPMFVELARPPLPMVEKTAQPGPGFGMRVKMKAADGAELLLRFPAGEPVDVAGLCASFWRRGV